MSVRFIRYNSDKLQRIGVLKVLVSLLDPQRRSQATDSICRKLSRLLFEVKGTQLRKGQRRTVYSASHLLQAADAPSLNFRFTPETIDKIVEWGKIYGFLGSGNQITERGLLFRYLIGDSNVAAISRGDAKVNPFVLTTEEKLYILFRQFEQDEVIFYLIKRLASIPADSIIRGLEADRLTFDALYDMSTSMKKTRLSAQSILAHKGLAELIVKIAGELDLLNEYKISPIRRMSLTTNLKTKPSQRDKKRTNTADNEAIPRFELLTDLGLLYKAPSDISTSADDETRQSWQYRVTPSLVAFANCLPQKISNSFCWDGYATCSSPIVSDNPSRVTINNDPAKIGYRAYDAYMIVKRPFGHTPLESVALVGMIRALSNGEIIEMREFHEFFLHIKKSNMFPDSVRYASSNELDKMFIDIKPSFINEVNNYYEKRK